jgi:hypothetical protein
MQPKSRSRVYVYRKAAWNYLMPDSKDPEILLSTDKARSGVTGHNVRYVLGFGLGGAILVFIIVLLKYGG